MDGWWCDGGLNHMIHRMDLKMWNGNEQSGIRGEIWKGDRHRMHFPLDALSLSLASLFLLLLFLASTSSNWIQSSSVKYLRLSEYYERIRSIKISSRKRAKKPHPVTGPKTKLTTSVLYQCTLWTRSCPFFHKRMKWNETKRNELMFRIVIHAASWQRVLFDGLGGRSGGRTDGRTGGRLPRQWKWRLPTT